MICNFFYSSEVYQAFRDIETFQNFKWRENASLIILITLYTFYVIYDIE